MGPGQSKWISYRLKQNSQNKETHFLQPLRFHNRFLSCCLASSFWPHSYTIRTPASNYNDVFQHAHFTDLMEGDTHLHGFPVLQNQRPALLFQSQKTRGISGHILDTTVPRASTRSVTHTSVHTSPLSWVSQAPISAGPTHSPNILRGWAPVPCQAPSWALRIRHKATNH